MRNLLLVACLSISVSCFSQNLRSGGVLRPEQAVVDIRHYTISLNVNPTEQTISGYTEIDLVLASDAARLLFDLTPLMTIKKAMVNGKPVKVVHEEDRVYLTGTSPFKAGKVKVRIDYGGKPGIAKNPPWVGGFQWEKDSKGNPWVAISCQMEGGKIFFPCKDHPSDEPNEGADLFITVPRGLSVAGPGLLEEVNHRKNESTFHWKTRYTISNYCLVFNVGKYRVVSRNYTTVDGNKVPVQFYVLEENVAKADKLLDLLERSCQVLEMYFGEYPWVKEKIGIVETPHLGMEHQTMNAYGNKFRYVKVGGVDFDWLLHHEFGHEWWANKVTNRDWAHMWIQEGICTFGDALIIRELEGEDAYLRTMAGNGANTQNKVPVVQGDEIDSDQAYQGDIYGKGAFFMHTLRYIMGDELFFPTLKKLATDRKFTYDQTVTTADVQELFGAAYGQSLASIFRLYLYTTDKLEVLVKQTGAEKYSISILNIEMALPIDILTDAGIKRMTLDKKGITVTSKTPIQVDPKFYYLKKVTYE